MVDFLTLPRRTSTLVIIAALIGVSYVGATFDWRFLTGGGPFWAFPVGPWLQDSADSKISVDVLDYLVGYTGLVNSAWTLPLFYVPEIGAPLGTNVVFLDVTPGAALIGRVVSAIAGKVVLPYGAWIGTCFTCSAVFAALLMKQWGQSSILATVAASIFAVSAPTLLHRFPHLPLMAHFILIGALWLYFIDQRETAPWKRLLRWSGWLILAILTSAYLMFMVGAVYGASFFRGWRTEGLRSRWFEPVAIGFVAFGALLAVGFLGPSQSVSGSGFRYYSMNLLSPITPQRSGLLPSWHRLVDATGGQYEGFSYLGIGCLVLLCVALIINFKGVWQCVTGNIELTAALLFLTLYALSTQVFLGSHELLDVNLHWRLRQLAGIYRSSGRMFWPAYYILLLGAILLMMRRLRTRWQIPVVGLCCVLQLIDTEPLRARLSALTDHGGTPRLDAATWSTRIKRANFVSIHPSYYCSDEDQQAVDLELQLAAVREKKPFNVVYNPRLVSDCDAEIRAALQGPWKQDTLYVYLNGKLKMPAGWSPPNLECQDFAEGRWCLGTQ